MNLVLRIFAGAIDLLQFIFFITLLAFQFITPVGGGITGGISGAVLCWNLSSGVWEGVANAAACLVGGGLVGAGLSFIAGPIGIAIDIALSCTFGVLLIGMLWASGRFSLMAVILGFGSEMMPGLNAFVPAWSLLVHRSIQEYNKKQGSAPSSSRTLGFLATAASMAVPEVKAIAVARAGARYTSIEPATSEQTETPSRIPLPTRNFDGIRPTSNNRSSSYAQAT